MNDAHEPLIRRALADFSRRLDARLITRGEEDLPYLWRGYLLGDDTDGLVNAFLHRFVSSDEPGELHSHPWVWAVSYILLGSYKEIACDGQTIPGDPTSKVLSQPRETLYVPGMKNVIFANTFHKVDLETPEVWTLFIHGPRAQSWSFVPIGQYGVPLPARIVVGKTSERSQKGKMVGT